MKNHIQLYTLFLMLVFCISCNGQRRTNLAKDTINSVPYGPNSITRTIKQDRNGNIWIASWEGIIRYNGSSFTNITSKISSSRFFSILEDRKGNFWFASIGSGVYYYDGKSFQNFTTKDGLINDRVTNIYEDKKENIWFGTEGGISVYNGKSFRNFTTEDGMPNNDVNAIVEDEAGKFWIGTRGEACFYDGKSFTKITNTYGKSFNNVRSIIKDQKGSIWLGGNGGLWRYSAMMFTQFTKEFVGYIYEDKKGNIWTSSQSNHAQGWTLSRYDEKFRHESVSATKVITEQGMFFGILEDFDENIWIGNLDGVCRYDGISFEYFKKKETQD